MNSADRAIAIVGVGAILPDAPSASAFWNNIIGKRYSITETPPERWSITDYYDADPKTPDKTYSKIGGWVRGFEFDWKRFRVPPKVAASMDEGQQWAVTIAADALADYGYPERPLDTERTGVILGTAMGGELHYVTSQRIVFPEYVRWLRSTPEFAKLPPVTQEALIEQFHAALDQDVPPITEDSMPGELPNIVSGRVANMLNLRGPNFITDAACASSFAAVEAAVQLLTEHKVDAVLTGGVDRNMGATTFVKFCKIGALSATGTRPFGDGADGFVMGEGAGAFLLKRLSDAERAGDKIYAVIRGVAGSSDGKGKGITAPNPIGQQLAVQRAWEAAGLDPATATLVEAHGTSTRVGDVVEVESLSQMFSGAARGSIGLGSAKSNIGHLKAGAGAAGLMKATMALHHKILPPTLNANPTNPNIDFTTTPFYPLHDAREWTKSNGTPRRAGVSAYGFGGTNFHLVLEEHVPGALTQRSRQFTGVSMESTTDGGPQTMAKTPSATDGQPSAVIPPRGILALGANSPDELKNKLDELLVRVEAGWTPPYALPRPIDIRARERLVIDFGDHEELLDRLQKARKVMGFDTPQAWKAMEAQGIFRGRGPKPGKLAFLFPGQGSQYVNMGRELAAVSPTVQATLDEADAIMQPILGKPLTSYLFVDANDKAAVSQANFDLMQTEITQPSMLTLDEAIRRLLADYGFKPDMVMGHSLGEYGALVAAGVLPFAEALEAAAGRGREMAKVKVDDNGWMAAVLAPFEVVEATLKEIDGYVVPANINSTSQAVIGGESKAVEAAIKLFQERGYQAMQLPVSHAFHTRIVAPASAPLRKMLDRMHIAPPRLPLVANVTGDFYPSNESEIKDLLEKQIASPVQWVKGLQTMHNAGVRAFVEVGPKRALRGFVKDVFGEYEDVVALMTNHPKGGELPTFNQALCGLYAAGYGAEETAEHRQPIEAAGHRPQTTANISTAADTRMAVTNENDMNHNAQPTAASLDALAQALSQVLQGNGHAASQRVYDRNETPPGSIVISGTGLGLPGSEKPVMDPDNAMRILRGEQFVDLIPERFRNLIVRKQITRLVKGEDGSGRFEAISDPNEVIKLAGRPGPFDLAEEYGVPAELIEALDITTQLAMAAGIDALREAGIPLVQTYKRTSTGKHLPERWMLPEALRDDTGVIFASAFPGGDRFANEFKRYYIHVNRTQQLEMLEDLRNYATDPATQSEINRRIGDLRDQLEREPYTFDRRFLFRILAMGHSQFAQYIGARGPNTQVNAACASTAQAIAIAEDWIHSGRCRRVVVIGADNVTGDNLMEWVGAGFLAVGAVTTKDQVAEAALPFDKRRHGTIMGMGACALVVESEDAVRERGMRGIVELLSSETSNSAFHGTRLDVSHIGMVMNSLITAAERRFGLNRYAIAPQTVFMSHETYTPARGGSASAEVMALRHTFGEAANSIIMANTKGFTGHPMGVGVEDVIAVKILEYGIVPPVPNFREIDPELGPLNLSRGGRYPVQYAIHLAAGFGSQISLTFTRRIPGGLDRVDNPPMYRRWLADVSGYDTAETEVIKRTLRVVAQGAPTRPPMPNRWQPGTGPTMRAATGGETAAVELPARMITPTVDRRPSTVAPAQRPVDNGQKSVEVKPQVATEPPQPEPIVSTTITTTDDRPQTTEVASPATVVGGPSSVVPATNPVTDKVLAIVAEQTGYPQEMLELDLDMEADLGIDTVKQAETFLAIRQAFDIPRRDNLKLRDYPTLGAVIGFVRESRPDLAGEQGNRGAGQNGGNTPVQSPISQSPNLQSPVSQSPSADPIAEKVLQIVAEQTGYPQEMLELDLDMEADLGIDTVKQAETFLAIRQAFDIPRRDNLKLRDYPTLGAVIGFVRESRPDLAGEQGNRGAGQNGGNTPVQSPVSQSPNLQSPVSQSPSADPIAEKVLQIVAEQTGYPQEMLELDLDMEADLGIDTVKQAETFLAIRQAFDIPRRDDLKLRDYPTLGAVIGFVRQNRPDLAAPAADSRPLTAVSETPPATVVGQPSTVDPVTDKVLAIVAEQTGYPQEMLELDLDMEADLGIDTVKQAETFLAIRQAFDIPRRDDLKLRDYPTLGAVIGFVRESRPDLAGEQGSRGAEENGSNVPVQSPVSQSPNLQSPVSQSPSYTLADADTMPRRVPVPSLRPSLDLCKPTGVTLDANSRVVVMADRGGVGKALVTRLEKLGATPLVINEPPTAEALEAQLQTWLAEGPIQGVYWLPALDIEPELEEMALEEWREHNRARVKNLYTTMRVLYDVVKDRGTFLVSATRLGGLHGYGPDGATAPLGGAVSGFTKAYKRERGDALVKVVDFEPGRKTAPPADALLAETLLDPGIVEVGYYQDNRYTVTLVEEPAADGQPGLTLGPDSVYLVTGAAGGITSAIIGDLAAAGGGGSFYLLDLVPEPARDDQQIALFRQGKDALKQHLIASARATGEKVTPAQIDKQLMVVERNEAALRAIESVETAGGKAHYRSVNLLDGPALAAIVDEIRHQHGRIDVLVHAGGIEISRSLADKDYDQFSLVYDIKADGFFSLLRAAKDLPIGATVAFSSVAGRFGNNGQTDYSAANDLLCKLTSSLRRRRPDTKSIVIDWTAWGEIGMATRGSIPKIMEMAGIDMLPPSAGIPTVRRELVAGSYRGEIVVGGRLGILADEWDETGGLDTAKANEWLATQHPPLHMVGKIKAARLYGGLQVETTLDPKEQPFLYDHAMDGTPLLPGVMGTEAFGQLATALAPGYRVAAVSDETFHAPFKFYRMESQTLHLSAIATSLGDENSLIVQASLRSVRDLGKPGLPPQEKLHFSAKVLLVRDVAHPVVDFTPPASETLPIPAEAIYRVYFHGPAYQVLERADVQGDTAIGLMTADLPPNTTPADAASIMAPRLIELCFQTAGVWDIRTTGTMALPLGLESVSVYKQPAEANGSRLYALVTALDGGKAYQALVVDESGAVYVDLKGYRTVELPGNVTL